MNSIVRVKDIKIGPGCPLVIIAGLCVAESPELALETAQRLKKAASDAGLPLIFKASYDKANRTSIDSYRGPGLDEGLLILAEVKAKTGLPILTDIHQPDEADAAAKVADVLQIPAFLCRQTDLIVAAAKTGNPVNVKKGQFLAPWDMKNVVGKITATGNPNVILTERGASFGYNNLVFDVRSIQIMRGFGCPVIFDATHSVQLPGGGGSTTSGQREFIEPLTRAAVSVGADGLFIEVHPDPDMAKSDGPNSIKLDDVSAYMAQAAKLSRFVREELQTSN